MKGKSRLQNPTVEASSVAAAAATVAAAAAGDLQGRPSLPLGPAQHVWDGRLLDNSEREQAEAHPSGVRVKNQSNKDVEHHQNAPFKGGTKLSGLSHGNKAHEQHPMTPPRISGVSLAPLPGTDCLAAAPDQPESSSHAALLAQQRRGSQTRFTDIPQEPAGQAGGSKPARRPPAIRVAALNGASGPAPALSFGTHASTRPAGDGAGVAAVRGGGGEPSGGQQSKTSIAEIPQLVAEGKAVSLARQAHADCPDSPDSPDIHLTHYREINDADSLCGTPAISLQALRRDFDNSLPLGPLSPSPLSPSILTLCGGLDNMNIRPDTGSSISPTGPDPGGALWDSSVSLPDMRQCDSPDVRVCSSPLMCKTPEGLPE